MKANAFADKLMKHVRSDKAISVFWALLGLAGPTFLQLIYIVLAARILGAELTGNVFLIVSVALVASSFVGLGAGGLVMRDTARAKDSAPFAFGRAKAMSYVTFPFLLPLVVICGWYITKGQVPLWIILAIGLSDLLAARIVTTSWSLFIALEEQIRASFLICMLPLLRLVAVGLTVLWPEEERIVAFPVLYFIASFSALAWSLYFVQSRIGNSPLSFSGIDHFSGVSFSLTWLNSTLQTESDKLLLGLLATPAAVAVYAVASRLMDGAAMPPRALRVSFQARMFREGADGHLSVYKLTVKLLPLVILYGLFAWFCFWLLAPIFVWVFGEEFAALESILPVLGVLPLIRAISDYGAEIFMSSDKPAIQALTQTFTTILRVIVGFFLIGEFMLEGAVSTALIVSAVSAVILWGIAWKMSHNKNVGF